MIYVYSDCDNAVACRDRAVLETYFSNQLAEDETEAEITELADDATLWGSYPFMNIDTWMIEQSAGVVILVRTLADLETLD